MHTQPVTGNTENTRPENRAFYPALDGLRAIAFLMVFAQHYLTMPWGWTGVNIFFVLSGFLITGILVDTRDSPHRARIFYLRRTLRIFPLYYGLFLVALLLTPLLHWQWSKGWLAWPLYLGNYLRFLTPRVMDSGTLLHLAVDGHLHSRIWPHNEFNIGHFWSLCVEEQFYLVWPWVVFWTRSRRALLYLCGGTVIIVPLLRLAAQAHAPAWMLQQELLYRATPFQLDSLLLGGLIALLWRDGSLATRDAHRHRLTQAARWVALAAGLAAAAYIALTLNLRDPLWRLHYSYPAWHFTWGLSFVNIFAAALILCCLHTDNSLSRLLALRPLRWIGRISYGAYVFHDVFRVSFTLIVQRISNHSSFVAAHAPAAIAVIGLPATLLIAYVSFRFFETPFLQLKERL
jgi:peptidoglycan/LPS O-acetylase OafA/YrhL